MLGIKLLEIGCFDILHQQIKLTVDLAVLYVTDDAVVIRELRKNIATAQEPAAGRKIKAQPLVHESQGIGFVPGVGGQPNICHSSTVEKFLEIKAAKRPRRNRLGSTSSFQTAQHQHYLSRAAILRHWEVRGATIDLTTDGHR